MVETVYRKLEELERMAREINSEFLEHVAEEISAHGELEFWFSPKKTVKFTLTSTEDGLYEYWRNSAPHPVFLEVDLERQIFDFFERAEALEPERIPETITYFKNLAQKLEEFEKTKLKIATPERPEKPHATE